MKDLQKGLANQFDDLMKAPMSRSEFVQYVGVAFLGVVGVTGLMRNLRHALPSQKQPTQRFAAGYGHGAYGK